MASVTRAAPMRRRQDGCRDLSCEEARYAHFRPNLSPGEILAGGAFGGTYFRDIQIDGAWYRDAWKEFAAPATDWLDGLDVPTQVASQRYSTAKNRYGVKCGQSLDEWLEKGWINPEFDSHGWFHWYCRFFLGRRCEDDARQVGRWAKCAGDTGRWRRNLIAKCVRAGKPWSDVSVSPVVRQTLAHWAYELTEGHYEAYARQVEAGARTSFVPQYTMRDAVSDRSRGDRASKRPKR
jgi:hypothetical protein